MDSSPAAQNDKAQTNALRATCHTERSEVSTCVDFLRSKWQNPAVSSSSKADETSVVAVSKLCFVISPTYAFVKQKRLNFKACALKFQTGGLNSPQKQSEKRSRQPCACLFLGSLCRKPLVKSRNWWFVSKCRSKNSALAKNLRKLRLNLQDFERILGENVAWKWAFEVLKNGYLRWVRACENLGLEKRDTKIFKGRFFKGVKFCDLAKWDFEKSAALYVGVDFFKGWI